MMNFRAVTRTINLPSSGLVGDWNATHYGGGVIINNAAGGQDIVVSSGTVDRGRFQAGAKGLISFSPALDLTEYTVVYVAQKTGTPTDTSFETILSDSSDYHTFTVGPMSNGVMGSYYNSTILDKSGPPQLVQSNTYWGESGQGVIIAAHRYSGTTASSFLNGVLISNFSPGSPPVAVTSSGLQVGYAQASKLSGYDILRLVLWDRALSTAEILAATSELKTWFSLTPTNRTVYFCGTSLTSGSGGATTYPELCAANLSPAANGINAGYSGSWLNVWVTQPGVPNDSKIDAVLSQGSPSQTYVLVIEHGVNDLTTLGGGYAGNPNGFTTALASFIATRYAAGWNKIVVHTILPREGTGTDWDGDRATANTTIRSWEGVSVDAVADIASDATIGANGAAANTTYYQDGVHPTTAGYQVWEPYTTAAINAV
jgi:lysophospholipase L1-like esterase